MKSSFWRAFVLRYKKIFSIHEIEKDIILQWFSGAVLFGFYVTFNAWIANPETTLAGVENSTFTCWPFFQSCGDWHWLSTLPVGISQQIVFMGLFAVMVFCAYSMYQKKWHYVHAALLFLFLWKLYFLAINFGFEAILTITILFFVWFYFFSHINVFLHNSRLFLFIFYQRP